VDFDRTALVEAMIGPKGGGPESASAGNEVSRDSRDTQAVPESIVAPGECISKEMPPAASRDGRRRPKKPPYQQNRAPVLWRRKLHP
jgi:hypothetical protein